MDTGAEYVEWVCTPEGGAELDLLIENLRVGETRFFRHRAHWRALIDLVIPALLARPGGVRAWSAGCATGEEAYTMALLLHRHLPGRTIEILASDLSVEALAVARERTYPETALAHVPDELRRAGFLRTESGDYRITDRLAACVRFEQRNLADGGFPAGFHVIFCRNVLIYFTPDARQRTVRALIESLAPSGYLFVGYAETLRDHRDLLALRTPDAVLYRKGEPPASDSRHALAPSDRAAPTRSRRRAPTISSPAGEAELTAEEAVIELRGEYPNEERLTAELAGAIRGQYQRVVVELDGATYLGDASAAVLRRARAAARTAGIEVILCAAKPGTRRWLERHRLPAAGEKDVE
jgi:chemotaxis protein methyltransferase CheR